AVGRLDLEHALADFEDGDVERASAEVVDGNRLVLFLVHAIGQRGGGRLVDDPQHLEAGDLSGILRRLALTVVEVRGDGDDGLNDLLAQIGFGRLLQLAQNHGGDLRRGVLLATDIDPDIRIAGFDDLVRNELDLVQDLVVATTHEPLDREDGVLRIRDRLPLGHLTDENLAVLGETHDRWCESAAFLIRDHGWITAFY